MFKWFCYVKFEFSVLLFGLILIRWLIYKVDDIIVKFLFFYVDIEKVFGIVLIIFKLWFNDYSEDDGKVM